MKPPPLLALFDIDGTLLLRAADAHRDALLAAIATVHGVAETPRARRRRAGRTARSRARCCCAPASPRSGSRRAPPSSSERACAEYAQRCPPDLSGRVAPGIDELLDELSRRDDIQLSLVTGNFEPIARVKLRAAGSGEHFPGGQGGFGSDHEDRTLLPAIARRRAAAATAPTPRPGPS